MALGSTQLSCGPVLARAHHLRAFMADHPRTPEQILLDYQARFGALVKALTEEFDDFFEQCDPERENLCLYGEPDGSWAVDVPAEEVPAELPEPCLGINFARNGMVMRDWLALVAVHSDAWLLSVAFYHGARLDSEGRARLFKNINSKPTLFEVVMERVNGRTSRGSNGGGAISAVSHAKPEAPHNMRLASDDLPAASGASSQQRNRQAADQPTGEAVWSDSPHSSGRLATLSDVPKLKGRRAELYWPDDKKWYLVDMATVTPEDNNAQAMYTSGEVEELDLKEIIQDGHLSLLA